MSNTTIVKPMSPAIRAVMEAHADYLRWSIRDLQTLQWSDGYTNERCTQITQLNKELTATLNRLQQE